MTEQHMLMPASKQSKERKRNYQVERNGTQGRNLARFRAHLEGGMVVAPLRSIHMADGNSLDATPFSPVSETLNTALALLAMAVENSVSVRHRMACHDL